MAGWKWKFHALSCPEGNLKSSVDKWWLERDLWKPFEYKFDQNWRECGCGPSIPVQCSLPVHTTGGTKDRAAHVPVMLNVWGLLSRNLHMLRVIEAYVLELFLFLLLWTDLFTSSFLHLSTLKVFQRLVPFSEAYKFYISLDSISSFFPNILVWKNFNYIAQLKEI